MNKQELNLLSGMISHYTRTCLMSSNCVHFHFEKLINPDSNLRPNVFGQFNSPVANINHAVKLLSVSYYLLPTQRDTCS